MLKPALSRRLFVGALIFAILGLASPGPTDPGGFPHVPGEVILKFKATASEQERDQIRAELGGTQLKGFGRIKAELRQLGNLTVEDAVSQYRNHPKLEYIEPNYIVNAVEVPNDPLFAQLYAMQNTGQTGGTPGADISATAAWDVFTGSDQVLIGVIDTGVDYTHPDLAANIYTNPNEIPGNGVDDDTNGFVDDVRGWDFYNNDNDPMDDNGHGSHVSGTIGAIGDNGVGVAGVCWNVKIVPLKFLSSGGSGSTADAVEAVNYATQLGVRLTSNSWGGGGFSQALYDAIQAANTSGILFVAAAGNSGANTDTSPHYPSAYNLANIVAVAATDDNDQLASFSNYGATTVDLAAPGVDILSTFPGSNYGSISGTSMATPHVSGALGLVFGRLPGIGHLDAKNLILNFVDPVAGLAGRVLTGGRLNAFMPIADPDSIPPGPVTNVAVTDAGSNWLVASWSATGDDGMTGTASRYIVKFSTTPIDASNFDLATTAANPPDPGAPGTAEAMRIDGLDFATTYYIALKALDEFGNASDISNVASGLTLGIPDIAASPLSFTESLLTGATSTQSLTLSNVGLGTLDFEIPAPQLITNSAVVADYVGYAKDEVDPRPGVLGNGGPDGFGYRWVDSDDTGGPAFDWVDISGTGTLAISTGDDVNNGPYPIGFTFPFYGVEYTQFRICSNGWLSFNSTSTAYSNQPLPNSGGPTALLAPFWDDLNLTTSGDVYYESDGSRLIVQWHNIAHYGSGGPYTFQVILHNDGTIEYQYLSVASPTNSCTIGIQNAAQTDGLQVVYNADYVHNNLKIRIAAVPQWVTVSPAMGTIYAPNSTNLNVAFDAAGLLGGTYDANIRVFSNDPDESPFTIPVQLTVIGAPDVELAPTAIDFGQVFIGATPMEIVRVQNPGTDVLHVSSVSVDNAVFSVTPTTFDVPPRGSVNVEVTFAPVGVATYNATLTVASDDPDEPALPVSVSGAGVVPPDFSVSPTSLTSNLFVGGTETQMLTLANAGGADLMWSIGVQFVSASQNYTLTTPEPPSAEADGGTTGNDTRTTPIQAQLADLTGIDILWDRSNGQTTTTSWTTIIADFTSRGATLTQSTAAITPELLANYDVLWLIDTGTSAVWDPAELAAIVDWVGAGGSLLLEGDNTSTVTMYNQLLTALGAGITFSATDGANGTTTNIHPHPTTENVTGIYMTAATASISALASPAGALVDDINGLTNTAYSQIGGGRIVAAADELFQNSRMSQASNQLFGNQVMDWLAGTNFLTVNPTSGTVAPGGSTDVSALFDATGLFGGVYEANVVITTNDPLASEVIVPVDLQVTGAPDLALDPTSIDYGQVFVGYPDLHEFEIFNAGTDMLTITDIPSDQPEFSVFLGGGAFPIQLAPFTTTVLQVRFAPPAPGSYSATLTIHSNDPDSPQVPLAVTGSGLLPPVAGVSPTSLHADLLTGETETQQVTVSNTGASDLLWSTQLQFQVASQVYTLTAPELPSAEADGGTPGSDPRTTPIQVQLADLTGVDILWDRSNGQSTTTSWTTLIADLTARGATVTVSTDPITPGLLLGYDVLWCTDTGSSASFDAAELAALTNWVNAGGGLLLEGDNTSTVGMGNDLLTALGAGLTMAATSGASGTTTNIHPHTTTANVSAIYLTANVAIISSVAAPGGALVDDIDGVTNTAYSQVGAGRVIVAADEIFQNTRMSQADNQLFGNQVFDWLAAPVFLSVDPTSGTVPAGGSAVVNVTFDATGLFGGDYAAILRVQSNDPAHGAIDVAATMHVTGVPRIGFSAASLDFGDVFIGYPGSQVLTVTNIGTDVLTVSAITPGLADYAVDIPSLRLAPFASQNLQVTFGPVSAGDRSTTLAFTSNDPDSPHNVALAGVGVVPPVISASPNPVVGAAMPGGTKTKTLTVCNTGGSDLVFQVAETQDITQVQVYGEVLLKTQTDEPGSAEAVDPRPGILGNGGPDVFGYTWIDSDDPGGPTFDWTDISGVGTPIPFASYSDNGNVGPIPIGFNFPFYGNSFSSLYACTNGWLSFTNSTLTTTTNQPLPNNGSSVPENLLAPWWDDMVYDESDGNNAYYYNDGTRLIVQYYIRRIAAFTPPFYRFQVILYPNGDIVYQYHTLGTTVNTTTIGIQNATKDDGLTVMFNDGTYAHEQLAILFRAGPDWLTVSPLAGVVPAGSCMNLNVTMDAAELEAGDYTGSIHLTSNDPATPLLDVDAVFHVGTVAAADFDVDPDALNLGARGNWVNAYVELPAGYAPEDAVVETVRLNGVVPADVEHYDIGDFNENGIPDLTFRFDRNAVAAILPDGESVEVTVTGEIRDTIYFIGTDTIRVIRPQLFRPNGREVLIAGGTAEIRWANPEGWMVTAASLYFSPDGGQNWSPIAEGVSGTSYAWQVPAVATTAGLVRVFVFDAQGLLGFDSSDQVFSISESVTDAGDRLPTEYAVNSVGANPVVHGNAMIELALPHDTAVNVRIYDVRGALVRELVSNQPMPAGRHQVEWDRTNRTGVPVSSGVYFVHARAGERDLKMRVTVLR